MEARTSKMVALNKKWRRKTQDGVYFVEFYSIPYGSIWYKKEQRSIKWYDFFYHEIVVKRIKIRYLSSYQSLLIEGMGKAPSPQSEIIWVFQLLTAKPSTQLFCSLQNRALRERLKLIAAHLQRLNVLFATLYKWFHFYCLHREKVSAMIELNLCRNL